MRLSRESKLVRWTYWTPWMRDIQRDRVSLCLFFWQAFLLAPLSTALLCVLCTVLSPFLLFLYLEKKFRDGRRENWTDAQWEAHYARRDKRRSRRERLMNSVFVQGLKTIKGRVCPLIEIVDRRGA